MEMSAPSVCVIIPAYNSACFIARTLESALAQDYPNQEVIVVDDGSTDNTREVVERFGSRVRYIRQENQGPHIARNRGVVESRGEFIAFLDSDDEWLPGRLSKCLQPMIDAPQIGMTWCLTRCKYPDGREETHGAGSEKGRVFPNLFWQPPAMQTSSTNYRRSVLQDVVTFERPLRFFEDQDFYIRVREKTRIACVDEILTVYHIRAASFSYSRDEEQARESYFQIIEDAFARWPDLYEHNRETIMAEAHYYWALRYFCQDKIRPARGHFVRSFRYKPSGSALLFALKTFIPFPLLKALRNIHIRIAHGKSPDRAA